MTDHDHGLAYDFALLQSTLGRRPVLRWLAGAGLVPLVGCSGSSGSNARAATGGTAGTGECALIPEETAGPYPGDGSNGPNVLAESGVVRSDIRTSIGDLTGTAQGVPLTVKLEIVASASCTARSGYAVYLWHCDRDANYSLYSITDQNYLRGVQQTDADGTVTFTTIFPACYAGRWPHIHFEIYRSLEAAITSASRVATSQLALPAETCNAVYATSGYERSVTNLASISLNTDNVFSDGASAQLATIMGSVAEGYVATLTVPVG